MKEKEPSKFCRGGGAQIYGTMKPFTKSIPVICTGINKRVMEPEALPDSATTQRLVIMKITVNGQD